MQKDLRNKMAELQQMAVRPEEAFKMLGISRNYGYQLLKEGKIPAIRLGGRRYLVPVSGLEKLLAEAQ